MSKDMLGPLVRASVGLSQDHIHLMIEVAQRLAGNREEVWAAILARNLRTGLPAHDGRTFRVLSTESQRVAFPAARGCTWESFDDSKQQYHVNRRMDPKLPHTSHGTFPRRFGRRFPVLRNCLDREVQEDLGEGYLFEDDEAVSYALALQVQGYWQDERPKKEKSTAASHVFYLKSGIVMLVGWVLFTPVGIDSRQYWRMSYTFIPPNTWIAKPGTWVYSRE
ncbi:MAG: hypothetical protein WC030_00655 [Candidatus Paceibacterota bacterium]